MAGICCEHCLYFYYDDTCGDWMCEMTDCMDEDEMFRLMESGHRRECPYYRPGDEYTIVQKQN